ncbi:hypothetical protein CVT24_010544 [Panaeolus cyanescens]|uniref:Fe2OG dioxygenase domain-containing protein n=1 Tax=Panaeolus cyanescens TaxID=181874 RepID=A0A409YYT3_9AGAR|nr:hypothetical protein CVT24_010544 [Panaeolus cyanescens]
MILEALINSEGDVGKAAKSIQDSSHLLSTRKRKAVDIEEWVRGGNNSQAKKRSVTNLKTEQSELPMVPQLSSKPEVSTSTSKPASSTEQTAHSMGKKPTQLPPLLLSNALMVKEHVPCTLHYSVLPPELACKLFYVMSDLSNHWKRNKWWLFDRVVESPHLTSFFARQTNGLDDNEDWQEAAQFWYNGRPTDPPQKFPPEMEMACEIVEKIVNKELQTRERWPLEWAGSYRATDSTAMWKANVAASNCYRGGKESVGFHSDQLTYLGPYPTIASLSLGIRRQFTLREVIPRDQVMERKARTFNVPLAHNSEQSFDDSFQLIIMHAPCQENFKHAILPQSAIDLYHPMIPQEPGTPIEPSNKRINITFRFYRPDFQPASIPRCHCNVPTILRPDMKNRSDGKCADRYWWTCYAGAQNDGKGCNFWKVMDMDAEGRGPCINSVNVK